MARQLTENQTKFLEVLFDEAGGNHTVAKRLAGYSENTPTKSVRDSLKDEILSATTDYLAQIAPRAAIAMASALDDPTELGIRDKMAAAKDLLDRGGFGKVDRVDVSSSGGGVFILPAKEGTERIKSWERNSIGYWEIPKPIRGQEKNWHTIARVSIKQIPFGYEVNPDNERLLEPIPT